MERRRNRTFTNMKASAFASAQSLPFAIVCLTKYIKIKKKVFTVLSYVYEPNFVSQKHFRERSGHSALKLIKAMRSFF